MSGINPRDAKPGEVYEGTVHGIERTVLVRRDSADSYPWESLSEVLDHKEVSDLVRLAPVPEGGGGHDEQVAQLVRMCDEADLKRARAEVSRDVWKARAEAAEWDRDDDYSERSQKAAAWDRVAAHPALRMDLLPEADHTYAGGVLERITRLAEAAEARTAPAVTRDEIDRALINVTSNAMNYPTPSQMLGKDTGPLRKKCVDAVCALFGIEAGQDVDPVEAKAIALWRASYPNSTRTWEEVGQTREAYRRMAAYVLGQEASDE